MFFWLIQVWIKMAKDLISYFDDNKMGNIVEIDYE